MLALVCFICSGCAKNDANEENVVNAEKNAKYSLLETAQKLQEDAYTNSSLTDTCYGLSDPSNVGVNKESFDDVRYPIPEDSEFEGDVINWNEYEHSGDNLSKLKKILNEAAKRNAQGVAVKLNMPENEVIDIDTTNADHVLYAIKVSGLDGFYLQGNGCTFRLHYENMDYKGFLQAYDGGDVHIQNVTVEYAVSPALTGIIQSYDQDKLSVTMTVDKEFNELVERLKNKEYVIYNYLEYTKATKTPAVNGTYVIGSETPFEGYSISGNATSGYSITVYFGSEAASSFKANGVGNYANVYFSNYDYNVFSFKQCGSIYIESVTMYSSPSMGVVGLGNENMYINAFRMCIKEGSAALFTAGADTIHIMQQSGVIDITNCILENGYDDALNVHSGYWTKLENYNLLNNEVTVTRFKATEVPTTVPEKGDILQLYREGTMELLATLTVASATGDEEKAVITFEEELIGLQIDDWSNCSFANVSSAKLTFENNIVQNKRNRGCILMTKNPTINNNYFANIMHGAVIAYGVLDQFGETTVPEGVVFTNNKVIGNNHQVSYSQGSLHIRASAEIVAPSGTIDGIVVKNNFFSKNYGLDVSLHGVGDVNIADNLFYRPSSLDEEEDSFICLDNADDVRIDGNYCYSPESLTPGGIALEGSTGADMVTLKDNIDFTVEESVAAVAEKVEVPHLGTSSISVDGDLSDWTQYAEVVITGASWLDESRAPKEEYSADFGVKQAMLAYDDNGIYFAFDVYDNDLEFKKESNFWYGDCVELFITVVNDMPNADMSLYKNVGNTIQMVFAPEWSSGFTLEDDRTSKDIKSQEKKFLAKVIETQDGYRGEAFIPFEATPEFKVAIDAGTALTVNCAFSDSERVGRQRVQLANVPHPTEPNKKKTLNSIEYFFVK